MNGPRKDESALTDCPADAALARRSGATHAESSGMAATCNMTFPMPSRAKPARHAQRLSSAKGSAAEATVIAALKTAVFFRPILRIATEVGIESARNQNNTADGRKPKNSSGIWPANSALT